MAGAARSIRVKFPASAPMSTGVNPALACPSKSVVTSGILYPERSTGVAEAG